MSATERRERIEFGDYQTPPDLAIAVCKRLVALGIRPDIVVEPTCGMGSFVIAAAEAFPDAQHILGLERNADYLDSLRRHLIGVPNSARVELELADFFSTDWSSKLRSLRGSLLVLGNFPWVTNAAQAVIGGKNLPMKSNFQNHRGFDAISGKANFDISESMLLDTLRWFKSRSGALAMLAKTAVARKVLAHAERKSMEVRDAAVVRIDAKRHFGAAVDACLLVIRISEGPAGTGHDYTVFESLDDPTGHRVGHRMGLSIGNLEMFQKYSFMLGESPQKWRSGIKHDAAAVMEFARTERGLENGKGDICEIEPTYLFPLFKGSDVAGGGVWRQRYVLVTQRYVGEPTDGIRETAPRTWAYLVQHAEALDARGSTVYAKNPRFSVFAVGAYAFRPWRVAICGLYKELRFRLVGPIEGCPVMFDDTVYYLSFDTEAEARETLARVTSQPALGLLSSLVFWDEKRPIKTSILNVLDWTRVDGPPRRLPSVQLDLNLARRQGAQEDAPRVDALGLAPGGAYPSSSSASEA